MQFYLLAVDRFNAAVGKLFAWSIVVLTLVITYEVVSRRLIGAPTTWAFDASYMLYGLLFMSAGAYTLSRNGHVRGDFLYRQWRPRTQAALDLVLYILFFFPGILAMVYAGWIFFELSYETNETSSFSPDGLLLWPFKLIIPITGVLMAMQGVVEVLRCWICLKTGEWPPRQSDVEETEQLILAEAAANKVTVDLQKIDVDEAKL
ncbi:TRAP transporter small permease subunit [Hansschlegelia beijingensis]|uniref:TRAP transporter small permease protein n=1 Tax=Hansschlegelia beijingensis TaxID=1133344 RepID=A0A7W6D118_9HYPH|nr:TRAP transporter small permease subunit [Hansschlegelia beijingensis]MBB3974766.1 TRAP-type mannitol/chloroaromatic compound transport system permease small subunit [Hansschlegelia beijingensis]